MSAVTPRIVSQESSVMIGMIQLLTASLIRDLQNEVGLNALENTADDFDHEVFDENFGWHRRLLNEIESIITRATFEGKICSFRRIIDCTRSESFAPIRSTLQVHLDAGTSAYTHYASDHDSG